MHIFTMKKKPTIKSPGDRYWSFLGRDKKFDLGNLGSWILLPLRDRR